MNKRRSFDANVLELCCEICSIEASPESAIEVLKQTLTREISSSNRGRPNVEDTSMGKRLGRKRQRQLPIQSQRLASVLQSRSYHNSRQRHGRSLSFYNCGQRCERCGF